MKKLLMSLMCLALGASLFGADLYISREKGSKQGPGTKEKPFKALADAIRAARPGDTIYMAAGNYSGPAGACTIEINKPVTIKGGYSNDFASRDIAKFTTKIQPPNNKNNTKGTNGGVLFLNLPAGAGPDMVVDGIVINQGFMNSYDTMGKPQGVETGAWLEGPAKGSGDKFPSANIYSINSPAASRYEGNIIIRNCIICNSGNFGINLNLFKGSVKILNNVFVACRMISCNVACSNRSTNIDCEFANNTVLFSWSRSKDLTKMGYGYSCNAHVSSNVHHNIFGLNVFAGIDDDKKGDMTTMANSFDNNLFFLNRQGDVVVSGNRILVHYFMADEDYFEDIVDYPGIESAEGNVSLKDPPATFLDAIDDAYLKAFLNAVYSEKVDYDENSTANLFRAAMGMNKDGKIEPRITMFCNRYPLEKTFKLFGAHKDFGAQKPADPAPAPDARDIIN